MSKLDYLSNQMAAGLFMVALFTSEKSYINIFFFFVLIERKMWEIYGSKASLA
jgi:hypothetical protein